MLRVRVLVAATTVLLVGSLPVGCSEADRSRVSSEVTCCQVDSNHLHSPGVPPVMRNTLADTRALGD